MSIQFPPHHPALGGARAPGAWPGTAAGARGPGGPAAFERELAGLRMAHLLEVETGFRNGDPGRAPPGEPRPEYDPAATTLTRRRQAKVAEFAALDRDQARLLGLTARATAP